MLGLLWGIQPYKGTERNTQIDLKTAFRKIEDKQIREITIKNLSILSEDVNGNKFETPIDSNETRERFLDFFKEYNKLQSSQPIKLNMEPVRSGWGWIVLINFAPFALIGIAMIFFIAAFFIAGKKEKLE